MAASFTVAPLKPNGDVLGSTRVKAGIMTLDASSGNVSVGIQGIWHVDITARSAATDGVNVTWTNTTVTIASGASGDDFSVMVWGS